MQYRVGQAQRFYTLGRPTGSLGSIKSAIAVKSNGCSIPMVGLRSLRELVPPYFWMLRAALVLFLAACHVPSAIAQRPDRWAAARARMVELEVSGAGVKNERVIQAMLDTPRHEFIPVDQRKNAYLDMALPIGEHQTISPPFIVAYMTEQLDPQPSDRVLEIGTGSGYQAAVLSSLVGEVYTIEIVEKLGKRAAATLSRLAYENVHTRIGDGYLGWPEHAPFDKIIVTCSPEDVPIPLVEQLREGGRMVVPVGERYQQTLYLFTKRDGKLESEALQPTMFVPMTGTAEEQRAIKPDPRAVEIVNGSFEETLPDKAEPSGWYYLRQARIEPVADAPDGERSITMSNKTAGRPAQVLQCFGVDGREVRELNIGLWVRAKGVRAGATPDQAAGLVIVFYDENRGTAGQVGLGPWAGSFQWRLEEGRVKVPRSARLAVMAVGLLGATGEMSFDAVQVTPVANRSALPK